MPGATNIDAIEQTLKKSLSFSSKNKGRDLDQTVASSAQRLLQQNIEFVPAKKPYSFQFSSLKSKYTLLKPSKENEESSAMMNGPGPSGDARTGESLPTPRVVIYPPEKVQLKWRGMLKVGGGLMNLGNTCFLNATLQCLAYTPALANYCLSDQHTRTCNQHGFCMMCTMIQHIKTALNHSGSAFKPNSVLYKLKYIAKHFRHGRQEDAHEFLRLLMDSMQKACLDGHKKLDKLSRETTVIHQIFGGFLQSQVQCLKCSARSNTYEPFLDLSLNLKDVTTVEGALAKFVKPDTLEAANAYDCERCGKKRPAKKRFSIHKAPNVLTIQLNRFGYSRTAAKINRHIQFPEKLNIRPYMSHRQGEAEHYQLYAALVHSGHSCSMGHYYCYVRAPSSVWYCMNDSSVHSVSASRVFQSQAYLLFYTKTVPSQIQASPKAPLITTTAQTPNGLLTPKLNGVFNPQRSGDSAARSKAGGDVGIPVPRKMVSPTKVTPSPFSKDGSAGNASSSHKGKRVLPESSLKVPSSPQQQSHKFPKDFFKRKPDVQKSLDGHVEEKMQSSKKDEHKSRILDDMPTLKKESGSVLKRDDSSSVGSLKREISSSVPTLKKEKGSITKENNVTGVNHTPKLLKKHSSSSSLTDKLPPLLQRESTTGVNGTSPEETLTPSLKKTKTTAITDKVSISVPSLTRINSFPAVHNRWQVQAMDSTPSPSLDSCPGGLSTPFTHGQWMVTASGKKRPLLERSDSLERVKKRKLSFSSSSQKATSDQSVVNGMGNDDSSQRTDAGSNSLNPHSKHSQKPAHKHSSESVNPFLFSMKHVKSPGGAQSSTTSVVEETVYENGDTSQRDASRAMETAYVDKTPKKKKKKKKKLHKSDSDGKEKSHMDLLDMVNDEEVSDSDSKSKKKKHRHKDSSHHDDISAVKNSDSDGKERGLLDMVNVEENSGNSDSNGKGERLDMVDGEEISGRKDSDSKKKKKKHRHKDFGHDDISAGKDPDSNGIKKRHSDDSEPHSEKKHHRDFDLSDDGNASAIKNSDFTGLKKRHRDLDGSDDEETSARKSFKRSNSENGWKEPSDETLQKDKEARKSADKPVPVQAWDHYVKDSLGVKKKQSQGGEESTSSPTPTLLWDGNRHSKVVHELFKRPSVTMWNGEKSEVDLEADKEEKQRKKKSWKDSYEEEIDRGKMKKLKKKADDILWAFNPFQKFQNHRNQEKFKWDEDFGSGNKTHSFAANPVPSLNRSHSDVHTLFSQPQPDTLGTGSSSLLQNHSSSPSSKKGQQHPLLSGSYSYL
ncbi:hypothetical protein ACOMHN_021055 [Nucella lapillus]